MDEFLKYILEMDEVEEYLGLDEFNETVMEASGVKPPADGSVIHGYFPYRRPDIKERSPGTTYHYGVVINHSEYGTLVPMGTSVDESKPKRTKKYLTNLPMTYLIPDPTTKGFTKDTVIKAIETSRYEDIQKRKIIGKVDANDIKEICSILNKFLNSRLTAIENLLGYMKMEKFSSTDSINGVTINNKFQSTKDMMASHKANSMDICTLVRQVCKAVGFTHRIIWTKFLDKKKWVVYDHFYVAYLPKKKPKVKTLDIWKVFRFFYIANKTVGILNLSNADFKKTWEAEERFLIPYLKPYHNDIVSAKTVVLDEEDLKKWDHFVAMKAPQKNMMDYLDKKYPGNLRKKDS